MESSFSRSMLERSVSTGLASFSLKLQAAKSGSCFFSLAFFSNITAGSDGSVLLESAGGFDGFGGLGILDVLVVVLVMVVFGDGTPEVYDLPDALTCFSISRNASLARRSSRAWSLFCLCRPLMNDRIACWWRADASCRCLSIFVSLTYYSVRTVLHCYDLAKTSQFCRIYTNIEP